MTLETLTDRGYLPAELPSCFVSKDLAYLVALGHISPSSFSKRFSKAALYSIPKIKRFTRIVSVPNPLHQLKLSQVISDHWTDILEKLGASRFSTSTPVEDSDSFRSFRTRLSYQEFLTEKATVSTSARYTLTTDVSRFFPTIYTHSIPWALHGKLTAKNDRSDRLFGNTIDKHIRNCQDQQTLGIPIGPDTSSIIAEAIMTHVDEELQNQFPKLTGLRYVDDYFIPVDSYSETDDVLSFLASVLKQFELEINETKTIVLQMPQPFEPLWM